MNPDSIVLAVQDLTVSYGNIKAVRGISFEIREGEIVTLIGANGAGESSTLRAISVSFPMPVAFLTRDRSCVIFR